MNAKQISPVFTHRVGSAYVQSYGKAARFDPKEESPTEALRVIEQIAELQDLGDVLWQRLPNDAHPDSRFSVVFWDDIPDQGHLTVNPNPHDAVILTQPGQTVVFATRDCPVLAWSLGPECPVVVGHCSRSALQGFDLGWDNTNSVIRETMRHLQGRHYKPREFEAVVTLGIAPEHFPNDRYADILTGLEDIWGSAVLTGKRGDCIDLLALIRAQLQRHAGMMMSQVEWDGLDTFSDPRLASHREGHDGYHNLVVVTYE